MFLNRRLIVAVASLAAFQLSLSLHAARSIRTVGSLDTASYYVVARNLAEGRGLTDTVLWQFLAAPAAVERPAGDYWDVGWPLVLGALMRLFGSSQHAAILVCAALSSLLPVAVFGLALAVSRRVTTAWLAGVLVCLQTRLAPPDVTPDVTLLYQLTCLAGMAVALRVNRRSTFEHLVAVGALLALPIQVRGEGFLALAAALPVVVARARASWPKRGTATVGILLGVALVGAPFWLRNRLAFGAFVPPSHALRLWMTRYSDLFRVRSAPSPERFWTQTWGHLIELREIALRRHVDLITRQAPWPLAAFAIVGVVALLLAARGRRAPSVRASSVFVPSAFVVLSLLVPCLVVPIIANDGRFVMNVLPVICVLAAGGVATSARRVVQLTARPPWGGFVAVAGTIACTMVFRAPSSMSTSLGYLSAFRSTPECIGDAGQVAKLHLGRHDLVMTDDAWRVAAVLDVPTVRAPIEGAVAEDAIIAKYKPRFLLADNGILRKLAERRKLRPVATMSDGIWYAFDP